jgi:hypothetical protein
MGNNVFRLLWGIPFSGAGIFIIIASLNGKLSSSSDAINANPLFGVFMGLLFLVPGLWVLQVHRLSKSLSASFSEERWQMLGMGLILILFGTFLVFMSFADDESNFNSPRWVVTLAGFVFTMPGLYMFKTAIWDNGIASDDNIMGTVAAAIVVTAFAAIVNWVSLGSGEREFQVSGSIPFISISGSGGEILGRLCFLPGALLLDFMAVVLWFQIARKAIKPLDSAWNAAVLRFGANRAAAIFGVIISVVTLAAIWLVSYFRYLTMPR